MVIPNGNSADSVGHLSVFVEHVNKDEIRNMVRLRKEEYVRPEHPPYKSALQKKPLPLSCIHQLY